MPAMAILISDLRSSIKVLSLNLDLRFSMILNFLMSNLKMSVANTGPIERNVISIPVAHTAKVIGMEAMNIVYIAFCITEANIDSRSGWVTKEKQFRIVSPRYRYKSGTKCMVRAMDTINVAAAGRS